MVSFLKRRFSSPLTIITGVVAGVLISSVLYAAAGFSIFGGNRESSLSTADSNNVKLIGLAYYVLMNIKDRDFTSLSRVAHPDYGVLFSPQSTVSKSTNKCFGSNEIALFGSDSNTYVWGVYGAGGEPIEMTPVEYFSRFVYNKDYSSAPVIGVNRIVKSGNALENIKEEFPNIQFVEFHIPGGEQDSIDDFDWNTLRLGFEEYDGSLWLTAIVHSEWSV